MSFFGTTNLNLDAKGRIAVPTEFRDIIAEISNNEVWVTADKSGCLMILTTGEWETRKKRLMELPNMDHQVQMMQRLYLGHASRVPLDSQGRIRIRSSQMKYARLEKRVALVGQDYKMELWDEDRWAAMEIELQEYLSGAGDRPVSEALANSSIF